MKWLGSIALAALGLILGLAAAAMVHYAHPAPPLQVLLAEHRSLQEELLRLANAPPAPSVHQQWEKLVRYVALYQQLSLTAADGEAAEPEADALDGRLRWKGVLAGPAGELILVLRTLQTIAAVRFERLSIERGQARLSLSVTGGPE